MTGSEFESPEVPASLLINAGFPVGATVTHLIRARWWRSVDARRGAGYSRRYRIRRRKQFRQPFVYVPNDITHVPHTVVRNGCGGVA